MKQLIPLLIVLGSSLLRIPLKGQCDTGKTYYDNAYTFAKNYKGQKKERLPVNFGNWGIRRQLEKGYEYNTTNSFEYAYVLYYFEQPDPNTGIGLYYQSDGFYIADLVKIIEKNKYSNPSSTPEGWGIPFYCSIYYHTSNPGVSDTISLCGARTWKCKDEIYQRKVFEFKSNPPRLTKLFEYRDYNPDPILMDNYEIELFSTEALKEWIETKKTESFLEEFQQRFKSPFNICLDSLNFKTNSYGWVYFADKGEEDKIESYTFYFKGNLYNDFFRTKKRYVLDTNLQLKYALFHPGTWFHKAKKIVPIFNIAVYDSVRSGKGKANLINQATDLYYYKILEKKTVKDYSNGKEYIWIKINLDYQIKKQEKAQLMYYKSFHKQQEKLKRKR